MQARPDREAAIHLRAGESLSIYLKAGTTIASSAGQLHLTGAPRWLGGQVFRTQATLADGEAWLLEESGWITLTASQGGSTVNICRNQAPSLPVAEPALPGRRRRPLGGLLLDWLRKTAGLFVPGRTARTCA